jgi:hypothetical protein
MEAWRKGGRIGRLWARDQGVVGRHRRGQVGRLAHVVE